MGWRPSGASSLRCHLEQSRDENGHYTHYDYDAQGRVTKVWTDVTGQSSGSPLVEYEYDGFGNVKYVRTRSDALAVRTTEYSYDDNNRVIAIDHPGDLGTEYFQYDAFGNLQSKQDGSGAVTAYQYDNLNRLVKVKYNYGGSLPQSITYPLSNADVTYGYEGGSRLRTSMVDSTGTSGYTYDDQGRLKTYTPPAPANRLVEYEYNALGQKTSMTLSNTNTQQVLLDLDYNYYANGWLKSVVKDGSTTVAAYKYDKVGNRTRVDLHNSQGAYTTYAYEADDPRYLLETIGHYDRSDTELLSIGYTRDSAGNPLTIGGQEYTYDANNRLDSWVNNADYVYDWVGNRISPPASPNEMVYNPADQLVTWPGQHTYDYLGTGSLHHQYDSTGQTVQKTYSYTPANLLQSVAHAGLGTSSMTWDADGNRITFTSSTNMGNAHVFVYDTTAGIPAVIEEMKPSGAPGGAGPVYYIREPGGELIARVDGEAIQYYHFDALGSTKLLTSTDGAVTDRYTHDPWGRLTAHTGSTTQPYMYVGQLSYYSHHQDQNLFNESARQMLQLGVRFYDPGLGRFTQVDPLHEGQNDYEYVSSNPLSLVDPSGRYQQCGTGINAMECMKKCRKRNLSPEMSKKFAETVRLLCASWCARAVAAGCPKFFQFCASRGDNSYGWLCMDIYYIVCPGR